MLCILIVHGHGGSVPDTPFHDSLSREFRKMGEQASPMSKVLHVLLDLRYVLLSAHAASDLRL